MEKENKEQTENINNEKVEVKEKKIGFFKKVGYSITKFEKYPTLADEGIKKAIFYLVKLVAIFALIIAILGSLQVNKVINEFTQYLNDEVPDFKFTDGKIISEQANVQRINGEEFGYGTIIVDIQTEDEETINQYKTEIAKSKYQVGIIVLKDKILQVQFNGTTYDDETSFDQIEEKEILYQNLLERILGVQNGEISKSQIVELLNGNGKIYLVAFNLITYLIVYFIVYFISSLLYVLMLSIIGFFTAMITKINLRYSKVFAMSVYAFTLSIILNMIYFIVNYFTGITISFFDIAYIGIAYVYMVAVLFLLKYENVKKQNDNNIKN